MSAVSVRRSAEAQRFLILYHTSPIILDGTAIGLWTRDVGWTTSIVVTTSSFILCMRVPHMLKAKMVLDVTSRCILLCHLRVRLTNSRWQDCLMIWHYHLATCSVIVDRTDDCHNNIWHDSTCTVMVDDTVDCHNNIWRDRLSWYDMVWHVWQVWHVWHVWHICHRSWPWQISPLKRVVTSQRAYLCICLWCLCCCCFLLVPVFLHRFEASLMVFLG